ncbi:MAG: 2-amino-4-hydroxy-6-hydroxymethyldihydropteridine diphosphokinase [Bacteroidota bacterium]
MHNIYLSLGSNLGNRFELLQTAVDAIFEEMGTVVKISSIYETPAMGFDGAPFLNCVVWVRSSLTPSAAMRTALKIERQMGRKRSKSKGYTSRPIDIDLLFVDDQVKKTKTLTLPHPEIEKRRFVIQPMAEVNAQFEHPVTGKNMIRILADTEDGMEMQKMSKWLRNPIKDYDISRFNFLAIEGNIGAGKTSLATMIAADFNAKLILERFMDNPFLPKFYKKPSRYAFPLEMSFLADRYQQLLDGIAQYDLFKDCVVADYEGYKSLIFAKVTLADEEYNLYKKLFHLMHKDLARPDLYVYLYQNTERLLQNISSRGRSFEQDIKADYLKKINDGYFEFIKTLPQEKVKIIDISEMDFVENRSDYLTILREIVG